MRVLRTPVLLWALPCAAAPEVLPLQLAANAAAVEPKAVSDYRAAIDAIVGVMTQQLGLPQPRGNLLVYRTREEFEQGLVEHLKISADAARATAKFAQSAVGSYNVLVNEPALEGKGWPYRIELIAHELCHSVQATLAGRPGLPRHQWLQEGFAEWTAFVVTDALGLDELAKARPRLAAKVRASKAGRPLPRLVGLDSFSDWTAARAEHGFDATYSLSFLAVDFLIARRSLAAVTAYYRDRHIVQDADSSFREAFGESVDEFERALEPHLRELLR